MEFLEIENFSKAFFKRDNLYKLDKELLKKLSNECYQMMEKSTNDEMFRNWERKYDSINIALKIEGYIFKNYKTQSYAQMARYLGVKSTLIAQIIKEIKDKMKIK